MPRGHKGKGHLEILLPVWDIVSTGSWTSQGGLRERFLSWKLLSNHQEQ
jgi:hypothetical protein